MSKYFCSILISSLLLFSLNANGNPDSDRINLELPPCNFNVSISLISSSATGALLKVTSDGQCGFTEVDPSLFMIIWYVDNTTMIGSGTDIIEAPFNANIKVTVKSLTNEDWDITTFDTPSSLINEVFLIGGEVLPAFSNPVISKGF